MEQEKNAGYTITERITVGDRDYVLGEKSAGERGAPFVTWEAWAGTKDYYHGHDELKNRWEALADLYTRAKDKAELMATLEVDKERRAHSRHEPER